MTDTIDFTVVGNRKINCSGCETNIRFALRRLPGIVEVTPSAQTQCIAVISDRSKITLEQIQARIREIGFEVKEIQS